MSRFKQVTPHFDEGLIEQHGPCTKFVLNCLHNCSAEDGHDGLCWSKSCYSVQTFNASLQQNVDVYCFDNKENICAPFPDPFAPEAPSTPEVPVGILIDLNPEVEDERPGLSNVLNALDDDADDGTDSWAPDFKLIQEKLDLASQLREASEFYSNSAKEIIAKHVAMDAKEGANSEESSSTEDSDSSDGSADEQLEIVEQEQEPSPDREGQLESDMDTTVGSGNVQGAWSHCDCCKCQLRSQHNWAKLSDIEKKLNKEVPLVENKPPETREISPAETLGWDGVEAPGFSQWVDKESESKQGIQQPKAARKSNAMLEAAGDAAPSADFDSATVSNSEQEDKDASASGQQNDAFQFTPPKKRPARAKSPTSSYRPRDSKRANRGASFNPFMPKENSRTAEWKVRDSAAHFGRVSVADQIADSAIDVAVASLMRISGPKTAPAENGSSVPLPSTTAEPVAMLNVLASYRQFPVKNPTQDAQQESRPTFEGARRSPIRPAGINALPCMPGRTSATLRSAGIHEHVKTASRVGAVLPSVRIDAPSGASGSGLAIKFRRQLAARFAIENNLAARELPSRNAGRSASGNTAASCPSTSNVSSTASGSNEATCASEESSSSFGSGNIQTNSSFGTYGVEITNNAVRTENVELKVDSENAKAGAEVSAMSPFRSYEPSAPLPEDPAYAIGLLSTPFGKVRVPMPDRSHITTGRMLRIHDSAPAVIRYSAPHSTGADHGRGVIDDVLKRLQRLE